jgi:HSP90 family molecular chaperone
MTASLRRKVLKSAYEKTQKSVKKVAQKSAKKLDQKWARQRMIEELLAREEEAKRKIAYFTATSRAIQEEKAKIELTRRKEFAIHEWYARNQSFYLKAELAKKKKAKMSDDISDDDLDECDICDNFTICMNCI